MTENNNFKTNETNSPLKIDLKSVLRLVSSSKLISALIFVLLGSLITIFVQNYQQRQRIFMSYYPNFYDRNFAEEMRLMEKRIDDILKNHNQYVINALSSNQKKDDNNFKSAVFTKQDDNGYYYELNFSGFKKEDIKVEVKDNILTFRAQNKKDSNNNYLSSDFYYSFFVPEYDTNKQPEIERSDDKITIKFIRKNNKN